MGSGAESYQGPNWVLNRSLSLGTSWSPGTLQEAARHSRLPSPDSGDAAWVSKEYLAGHGLLGVTLLLLSKRVSPMSLS